MCSALHARMRPAAPGGEGGSSGRGCRPSVADDENDLSAGSRPARRRGARCSTASRLATRRCGADGPESLRARAASPRAHADRAGSWSHGPGSTIHGGIALAGSLSVWGSVLLSRSCPKPKISDFDAPSLYLGRDSPASGAPEPRLKLRMTARRSPQPRSAAARGVRERRVRVQRPRIGGRIPRRAPHRGADPAASSRCGSRGGGADRRGIPRPSRRGRDRRSRHPRSRARAARRLAGEKVDTLELPSSRSTLRPATPGPSPSRSARRGSAISRCG
jgi:hypothetical protein